MRIIAVNIDMDDLRYYRAIHALAFREDTPVIFEKALPRFLDLCSEIGICSTIFVIAEDLKWESARDILIQACNKGHEIASHSLTHPYNLTLLSQYQIEKEAKESKSALEDVVNKKIVGFRAPGYNISDMLIRVIESAGYIYDSSILPSIPYYIARLSVITYMRITGRKSASIPGRFSDFTRNGGMFRFSNIQEFPITSCTMFRLPLIGTTIARGGFLRNYMISSTRKNEFINIEFHALDFLDVVQDKLDEDLMVEPVLKIPLERRLKTFQDTLQTLMIGRKVFTLQGLATCNNTSPLD